MKISLSLLKEFIDVKKELSEIAALLTSAGVEVDKIENEIPSFSSVVSAKVIDVKKHPSADNLSVATVFDGKENIQVVCGAENCKKDLVTAFAKIGASLKDHDGNVFKIRKAKLRGVESFGMLCSGSELLISEDKDGILDLGKNFELGKDLSFLSEPVFEISLTPNLGHLLSALGIAKELATLCKTKIQMPKLNLKEESKLTKDAIQVKIEDKRCTRYAARVIEDIEVKESPLWLKAELERCGFRSINNIVDVTNYIMLKFGHPMHAFDIDKIEGKEIIATNNDKEVNFLALDKIERKMPLDSLVIKDQKKPIAIAGVIGGMNSAISESTKTIVLEMAHFEPHTIRKTSKVLNVKTQSSLRFEKSVDPSDIDLIIDYAAALIQEITNGKVLKDKIDIVKTKVLEKEISMRVKRAQDILGTKISVNEMKDIFERLDFKIVEMNDDAFLLQIPTFRQDISLEIDLIEEIARIYGYNNISVSKPYYRSSNIYHSEEYLFEKRLKSYLRANALQEVKTCDLISPKLAEVAFLNLPLDSQIQVKHYKSIDQSILRPTLLPSLLEVVKYNQDHKNFDILAYEVSKIHFKDKDNFIERPTLSIILCGKKHPHHWEKDNFDVNFYDLKGIIENLFSQILKIPYKFIPSKIKGFHPHKQAAIAIDNKEFAIAAQVHPHILQSFDIKKNVYFAEIDLSFLEEYKKGLITFKELSQFPFSTRDVTLSLDQKLHIQKVYDVFDKIDSKMLKDIILLDLYKTEEKNNVTFRFTYQDFSKTLSNEEVEKEHTKISQEITKHLEKYTSK